MDLGKAAIVLDAFQNVPRSDPIRPTFMELSGYPHYENVCSNILAFFLDPLAPHGLGSLCLDALLQGLGSSKGPLNTLSNVTVERESVTESRKRFDILVSSDSHFIAIENKIYHSVSNPFDEYAKTVSQKAKKLEIIKILLALYPPAVEPGHGFVTVSYAQFIGALRSRLGHHIQRADSRYLIIFSDFLNTIDNLKRGTQMDAHLLTFIQEHQTDLESLLRGIYEFKSEMRRRVTELATKIETKHLMNVKQFFFRESGNLYDTLVHDFEVPPRMTVAVDTVISSSGWEIQFFERRGDMGKLRELLQSLEIPINEGERFTYKERFTYTEEIERLQSRLQEIVDKLGRAGANPAKVPPLT